MKLENIDGVMNLVFDNVSTVAMAAILLLFGYWVRKKIPMLERFCIPAPVIGGFAFMFINFFWHLSGAMVFKFDTMFQAPFMLAFFTTVGLGASFALLKKGGILLVIYWLCCGTVAFIQNSIGMAVSKITGLEPAYALISSAISMLGGHGAAAAYGDTFVNMGFPSGTLVGMAAATFGLISGVLIGGPLGRRLIVKYNLKPDPENDACFADVENINKGTGKELDYHTIMTNVTAILICMAVGAWIASQVSKLMGSMSLPTYVGAMFVAVLMRNFNEKAKVYRFEYGLVEKIGDVMLGLYLSMALMSLNLWELAELAGPLVLLLGTQVLVLALLAYFVIFRILGKNYDAAVMCAGLMGHGLGATPSAIVNMSAVGETYGVSKRAMMIVPIVGAFLVDIIYQPVTIWFVNTFVKPV